MGRRAGVVREGFMLVAKQCSPLARGGSVISRAAIMVREVLVEGGGTVLALEGDSRLRED